MLIAPMAMQCMAHPDGELAVSRAAAAEGISMVRLTLCCRVLRTPEFASCTDLLWYNFAWCTTLHKGIHWLATLS